MRLILVSADLLAQTISGRAGVCRTLPSMGGPFTRCFSKKHKPNRAERRRPPPAAAEPKASRPPSPPPPPRPPKPPSPMASEPLFPPTSKRPKILKGPRLQGLAPTRSPWVYAAHGMDLEEVLPSDLAKQRARAIFQAKVVYLEPASLDYELPKPIIPDHTEVAVIGRSNVGKSSLVGALLGPAGAKMVRVSKRPGCTQSLHMYTFEGQPLHLVDLPGYGFAKAPEEARDRWMDVAQSYLENRGAHLLRRTLLLVDARHGPSPMDVEVMKVLDHYAVTYQIVLTKADAVRGEERERMLAAVGLAAAAQRACLPIVQLTSAKEGHGIQELRDALAALVIRQ